MARATRRCQAVQVLVQAHQALAGLEVLLGGPPASGDAGEDGQRDVARRPAAGRRVAVQHPVVAVLAAPVLVPSLPYLSLEPGFRRGHGARSAWTSTA